MTKLKIWKEERSWEEAERLWEEKAAVARRLKPLKRLPILPSIPGITPETQHHLKLKSLFYILFHKEGWKIIRSFCKHPLRYGLRYLRSSFKKKSYIREGDFFYYGFSSQKAFLEKAADPESLLVVGFSYCQKPHECPSGRFTPDCIRDPDNLVCSQCPIGKAIHALPERAIPLLIPTIHYIGEQIFTLTHQNPAKQILFLITACELTLEMFGDLGNMVGALGIGVRLDGRICNTMKAFVLSEEGIKPGLTVLTDSTEAKVLQILRLLRGQ